MAVKKVSTSTKQKTPPATTTMSAEDLAQTINHRLEVARIEERRIIRAEFMRTLMLVDGCYLRMAVHPKRDAWDVDRERQIIKQVIDQVEPEDVMALSKVIVTLAAVPTPAAFSATRRAHRAKESKADNAEITRLFKERNAARRATRRQDSGKTAKGVSRG